MDLVLVQTEVVFLRMQKIFGSKLIEQIFAAMRCIPNEGSKTLYAVLFLICFIMMTYGCKYRSGTAQTVAILIPEKGYDIALFDVKHYTDSVEHLLKDPKEFQIPETDPTISRTMLCEKLLKEIEITKDEFDLMRSKNAKPTAVHGLQKIR